MQLTLTLDIGNTNPHVGWFIDGELKQVTKLSELTEQNVDAVGARKVQAVTSKVGHEHDLSWLAPFEITNWRNTKGYLGVPFKYAGTLGADRLVQIHYLLQKNPGKTALIDAGTFTTVDLSDDSGHLGGIIIPGLETYLDVFKLKGAKLPRLGIDQVDFESSSSLFALNTFDAIAQGYKLLLSKVSSEVADFSAHDVILTGGHAEHLKPLFPRSTINPHLIHHALFHSLSCARELGIL